MVSIGRVREDVAGEPLENGVERGAGGGRRLSQPLVKLDARGASPDRPLRQGRESLDQEIDDTVAKLSHRLAIELERMLRRLPLRRGGRSFAHGVHRARRTL